MELIKVCVVVAMVSFATAEEIPASDFQLSDYLEITRNSEVTQARSDSTLESTIEQFMKSHDVTFKVPVVGSTLTFAARNLDQDEVDVKLRFNTGSQVEARKKSKLRKILVPFFIFMLIKAMVMIPLALGVLAIKTWNALQLSFFSFVVALALGVWQLCTKISGDHHHHPQIVAHSPWEVSRYAARALDAQGLAYAAYAPQL